MTMVDSGFSIYNKVKALKVEQETGDPGRARYYGNISGVSDTIDKTDMMNYIVDRFGDAVETSPTDHEHFTAVAEVSVSQTFFAWAFQFNGDIQIKGPESVVDRYKAMLTSALDK